jgi:uroporphyrinogen-III synthase
MQQKLKDIRIALPESRQLDVLAQLCEKRGANVFRCPLVSIHDSPEKNKIEEWLKHFIKHPPDFLIILTGEGIRRLTGFAERAGLVDDWKQALAKVHKLARGPKPNRALKLLDLQAEELALQPTTDGVILSLDKKELTDQQFAVQLYGEDPNKKLQDYLQSRKVKYNTVAPYIYASDVETDKVIELIHKLSEGNIDVIGFTSKAQFSRLQNVAKKFELSEQLSLGLKETKIAAVGPVVAEQLEEAGFDIAVMPEDKFFMKPMVTAIESLFVEA